LVFGRHDLLSEWLFKTRRGRAAPTSGVVTVGERSTRERSEWSGQTVDEAAGAAIEAKRLEQSRKER
jgi:hypothetical protein